MIFLNGSIVNFVIVSRSFPKQLLRLTCVPLFSDSNLSTSAIPYFLRKYSSVLPQKSKNMHLQQVNFGYVDWMGLEPISTNFRAKHSYILKIATK